MSMRTNSLDLNWIRPVSRRGLLRAAALLVVALTVLAASGVWAAPAATDRYVATTGVDSGDCSNAGSPCLTIQYAINQAAAGDTINVADGTYVENVSINKNIVLLSANGRAATTIQGVSGIGAAGAVYVTGSTTGVEIGATGQGFTIIGIDNGSAGIENAAVYIQGTHSNGVLRDNEIQANGESGLLGESAAVLTDWTVDGNTFSGQTFTGITAADCGFGNQFSTPNVPRQLVTIGNGGGVSGANVTGFTFTNNQVTGTTGSATSATGCELVGQGNTLATIDAADSTITGNTFDGVTARFATSLRVRRPGTTVTGNTFNSDGLLTPAAGHFFFQNASTFTLGDFIANNTFDRGAYLDSHTALTHNVTFGFNLQGNVDVAPDGDTLNVLAGDYNQDVNINKALTMLGAGIDQSTIIGVKNAGNSATVRVSTNAGVLIDGFTITRDGNNPTDWNANVKSVGLAIQGTAGNVEVRNNKFVGNRTGIDLNFTSGNSIHNNVIDDNRTGIILRNQCTNNEIYENSIADNWTVGVLWLNASTEDATGTTFFNNDISGNWYTQIENRSLTGGVKNFSGNWLGSATLTTANTNGAEPGYTAQIPVAYGGTATPPGGAVSVRGVGIGDMDYTPWLAVGTDTDQDNGDGTIGFQGDFSELWVDDDNAQTGATGRIQEGIDLVSNSTVNVAAGTYNEATVNVNKAVDLRGANYGIDPNTGTRVAESILNGTFSLRSSDISIDGFSVIGASYGFATGGSGPWSDITLSNNIADGKTGGQVILNGFGVVATTIGSENWTISNNRITDIQANAATAMALFNIDGLTVADNVIEHTNASFTGRRGINLDGSLNVTVSGNSIDMGESYPAGTTNTPWAIQVSMSDRAVSNVTIEDNTIANTYYGVVGLSQRSLTDFAATGNQFSDVALGFAFNSGSVAPVATGTLMSNISVTDNDIDSSNRGVFFRNLHSTVNGGVAFNNLDVNDNNLVRTTSGAALDADAGLTINDGQVDGTCNWFGSANPFDVQARVAGAVTFLPFQIAADGACTGTGPVVNVTQSTNYFVIQTAVDAANPNDEIQVAAGTYAENVTINKALSLYGVQKDVAVSGRTAGDASEATIVGQMTIAAADVEVNGFTLTNPGQTRAVLINLPASDVEILYNHVYNVGAPAVTSNVQGIYVNSGPDNVTIANNRFDMIVAGSVSPVNNRSANGILVGDSSSNNDVDGLVVQDNAFTNISASRGAYGLLINVGSILGSGVTNSPQIIGNSFDGLSGLWTHAIGLEGETPGAVVEDNEFSNLTAGGVDNAAIFFEKNPDGPSVTLACNKFNATAGAFFGIAIHPNDLPGGSNGFDYEVDGTLNYWGDADGPTSPGIGNGAGVGLNVLFSPWYVDDTCTTTAAVATINIVLDTQPDAAIDVNFTGDLGVFTLDDDADGTLPNTETQLVLADATYDVVMTVPSGYFATSVTCDSANGVGDKPTASAEITPDPNEEITCTFVNAKAAQLSVLKVGDINGDGALDGGESLLPGWNFDAFDGVSMTPLASDMTNFGGVAYLLPLEPGVAHVVCEELDPFGTYANTNPGFRDATYNEPCKSLTLEPGEFRSVYFSNIDLTGNDADGDRIGDGVDNCEFIANPTQADANSNGVGDACESTLTFVLDAVPNRATNFIFNGDLGYFLLDDDSDPVLPNTRSYGIETGSGLGSVVTTQSQSLFPTQFDLAIDCGGSPLATITVATGTIEIEPTVPGQTVTCTFTNTRKTTRGADARPPAIAFDATLLPAEGAGSSAVFNWTVSDITDVTKVDIYFASTPEGRYMPLLLNMPVEASGNAVFEDMPAGTWYYQLVVWLATGEPLTVAPLPLSPAAPTAATLAAQQAANVGNNVVVFAVAAVAMLALGTFWVADRRRRTR